MVLTVCWHDTVGGKKSQSQSQSQSQSAVSVTVTVSVSVWIVGSRLRGNDKWGTSLE